MSAAQLEISQQGWDPDLYKVIASTLERIEAGEKEGGSKAFIERFSSRRPAGEKPAEPIKWAKSIPHTCSIGSSPERDLVIELRTEDGYVAKHTRAFWPSFNVIRTGVWNFNSWEEAQDGTNVFIFTADELVIPVIKKDTGKLVGQFIADRPAGGEEILPGFAHGYQLKVEHDWHKV